ncbi:MAG: DUF2807 domain-containing protein [Bacteroidota bacterium]
MTTLKAVLAIALTAVVLTSSAYATLAAEPQTKVTTTTGVNKIWVSGNVKLVLTQGDKESIKGTENFDAAKTSVHSDGQTLFINSTESSPVTINITMKDLQRVEAFGQSSIVTTNNFDVRYLQLFLSQSATAKISAVTGSLYTVINDDAVLKMSGAAHQHTSVAANANSMKLENFFSVNKKQYASENIMAAEKSAATLSK